MFNEFSRFKDYLYDILAEARLKKEFMIDLNGVETLVIRDPHVMQHRGNSPMPRDGGMSKNKYQKVLSLGTPLVSKNKTFSITWSSNGMNNVISGEFTKKGIVIFGAILKSKKAPQKLYPVGTNRTHLGDIVF